MPANELINSTHGLVNDNVDGFPRASQLAMAELCSAIVSPALFN